MKFPCFEKLEVQTKIMKWIDVYKTQGSQIKINGTPQKSFILVKKMVARSSSARRGKVQKFL